ncbi:Thiaminase [Nostoc flagelliforme CCNUN1]|uniref:Thiaminase n=1 Tax=Nostoc flagelliforme CCNUN1 TaxID=2038116 RepID=A0A2K8SJN7_9NOSO|nr:hypothetical protein [Nostoc flagelliforme]AUB35503.1 Thiaminase [Nostoc flagelliforme CCNUN1]
MTSIVDIEWARIAPDKVIVASADRVYLHQLNCANSDDPFAQQMNNVGKVATTRKLLDGIIAFVKSSVLPKTNSPALNPTRWVWRLAGLYHLCCPTQELMEKASENFALKGRKSLSQWAIQKAREEASHDLLALLDIQSMGYKADAVVKAFVPPVAKTLTNYFTHSVQLLDPIGCVGYSYTIERLALSIGEEYIQAVEALLPSGINATRCLRIHSRIGSDLKHIQETVEMVAGLTPLERTQIAISCYETALLYFSPPQLGYISEEELEQVLKPLELTTKLKV